MPLVNISVSITFSTYESIDLDLGGGYRDQIQLSAIVTKTLEKEQLNQPTTPQEQETEFAVCYLVQILFCC